MSNGTTTSAVASALATTGSCNSSATVPNALTVDVEDYFHAEIFADVIDRAGWEVLPSRVDRNVAKLLDLFDSHKASATFFILGWVAERHPQLVRDIASAGHEVASHGWAHVRVDRQEPHEFQTDCARTKQLLEDIVGKEVQGYRAATFSMNARTPWAHSILRATGYEYSSSIYPIRHDLYGMPDSPRFPYRPSGGDGVVELPISTLSLAGKTIPSGGGGYFRFFPPAFSRWAIERVNRLEGKPCIFYLHPWEVDPHEPRQVGLSLKSRFRHYLNRHKMEDRLARLLDQFVWKRMDEVFRSDIHGIDGERNERAADRS